MIKLRAIRRAWICVYCRATLVIARRAEREGFEGELGRHAAPSPGPEPGPPHPLPEGTLVAASQIGMTTASPAGRGKKSDEMSTPHVQLQVERGPTQKELTALLKRAGLKVNVTLAPGEPVLEMEDGAVHGAPDIRTFAYIAGVNLSRDRARQRQRQIDADAA